MHVPTGTITPLHSEVDELQQALHGSPGPGQGLV